MSGFTLATLLPLMVELATLAIQVLNLESTIQVTRTAAMNPLTLSISIRIVVGLLLPTVTAYRAI